jgi:hypothetical protein
LMASWSVGGRSEIGFAFGTTSPPRAIGFNRLCPQ